MMFLSSASLNIEILNIVSHFYSTYTKSFPGLNFLSGSSRKFATGSTKQEQEDEAGAPTSSMLSGFDTQCFSTGFASYPVLKCFMISTLNKR